MKNNAATPNNYEKIQIASIEKWINKNPGKLSALISKVLEPVSACINSIVPSSAIEGTIIAANKAAEALTL